MVFEDHPGPYQVVAVKVHVRISTDPAEHGTTAGAGLPLSTSAQEPVPSEEETRSLVLLFTSGRLAETAAAARKMTRDFPRQPFGWKVLGTALMHIGNSAEAETALRKAIELSPGDAETHCNLGFVLYSQRRFTEAETCYGSATRLRPDFAEAFYNLGNLLKETRRLQEAAAAYGRAIDLKPAFIEALIALGQTLQDLGRLTEAENCYDTVLKAHSDSVPALFSLAVLYRGTQRLAEAEAMLRRVTALKPDWAEAHNHLGLVLIAVRRIPEAEIAYREAIRTNPQLAPAHFNLGNLLNDENGQPEAAERAYRRAIELDPGFAMARYNLGLLLLRQGRYSEGWSCYEVRHDPSMADVMGRTPPPPAYPQWKGEPLHGKSLVIWPEQGFGDSIQCARYLPLLKKLGLSRLSLVHDEPLKNLLESVEGVDAFFTDWKSVPEHDYWCYPLSLPLRFGTTTDHIPAALPYVHARPERRDAWRDRLPAGRFKVGLVWKGSAGHANDANRSLPGLSALAPLWQVQDVVFVSLQKEQGEAEAIEPPPEQPIVALGMDMRDFADAAAIVAQLDLVICVDTAMAHLAGALGKECWVMLPAMLTDWRWMTARGDSPWYPGVMRLFRQRTRGEWTETISEVAAALRAWSRNHAAA